MEYNASFRYLNSLLFDVPAAYAVIKGSIDYPNLHGIVRFFPVVSGILLNAEIYGLPVENPICSNHIFGFHIHNGDSCASSDKISFPNAGTHYNPGGCEHPSHAGDLSPLFATFDGFAWNTILLDRFKWGDILGLPIIIHQNPDDFTTQPSGNSGTMIGCGIITKN